jgi:Flp pilus assembly protein TadG
MFVRVRSPQASRTQQSRCGAVLVENALVASIFGVFLAGIMEFGHAYMVQGALNAAVKRGARYGSVDLVSTSDVKSKVNGVLNAAFKSAKATVIVKDASTLDSTTTNPKTIDYNALPDIELNGAKTQQLFVVRASVPYNSVALLPPFWIKNLTLKAQAVMRHE